jgi:hypothetical protein
MAVNVLTYRIKSRRNQKTCHGKTLKTKTNIPQKRNK